MCSFAMANQWGSKIIVAYFLEGKRRKPFFQTNPPRKIHVFSSRASVAKGGDFVAAQANGNAITYAWFVWEKGYKGDTVVDWIN
ncbi:hypothetical protein CE91St12_07040 [Bacteroides uniformis]|uniref:Uncharacterized protein n=2 Tax=Bacteroides uniformis TaxID=820 RepID=A0AA37JPZ2_BACUN|nr:hypothetical protein CE91St12_07040 [Bacteroides uniformis]GKH35833.1 hypothetical protein CE91St13_07040 [Bacteroides uniformis]